MDQVERLRGLVRLQLPEEVQMLVGAVGEHEWERVRELQRQWPAEHWPIPGWAVRACLDGMPVFAPDVVDRAFVSRVKPLFRRRGERDGEGGQQDA
jgi:hypothetical protein